MSDAFVWFHNSSGKPTESTALYEALLGWRTTAKAVALSAEVVTPKTRGPAREYVVARDFGGAAIALWQRT